MSDVGVEGVAIQKWMIHIDLGITVALVCPQLCCCQEKNNGPVAIICCSMGKQQWEQCHWGWKPQATLRKNYFGLREEPGLFIATTLPSAEQQSG